MARPVLLHFIERELERKVIDSETGKTVAQAEILASRVLSAALMDDVAAVRVAESIIRAQTAAKDDADGTDPPPLLIELKARPARTALPEAPKRLDVDADADVG